MCAKISYQHGGIKLIRHTLKSFVQTYQNKKLLIGFIASRRNRIVLPKQVNGLILGANVDGQTVTLCF